MSLPAPRCPWCAKSIPSAAPNAALGGIYAHGPDGFSVQSCDAGGLTQPEYLVDTLDDVTAIAVVNQLVGDESAGVLAADDADAVVLLEELGRTWSQAQEAERQVAAAAYALIRHAVDEGLSESEVARRLGVDRMTVRRAVGKL